MRFNGLRVPRFIITAQRFPRPRPPPQLSCVSNQKKESMLSLPALTIGVLVASTAADYVFQSATVGNGCDAPGLLVQAHNGVCVGLETAPGGYRASVDPPCRPAPHQQASATPRAQARGLRLRAPRPGS